MEEKKLEADRPPEIVRTPEEIDAVLEHVENHYRQGSFCKYLHYEEGLEAMYLWLVGKTDEHPIQL